MNNKPDETPAHSQTQAGLSAPTISLPRGGGAIRGMGEKFAANPVTGTGAMSVPIATSPGRSGFGPQLALSYDSGAGNGPFGFGWSLSLPNITRKTDKGLPRYQDAAESDVFILSGAEDLVPVLVRNDDGWQREKLPLRSVDGVEYRIERYRPRIEGLFARIERWTNTDDPADVHWRSISKDNSLTLYGKDPNSRISDPADASHIFSWLICETRDDKGNAVLYEYQAEDGRDLDLARAHEANRGEPDDDRRKVNRYIKRIFYGNRAPLLVGGRRPPFLARALLDAAAWMFEVVFDYDESHVFNETIDADQQTFVEADTAATRGWKRRNDPFSSYRSGFEVRTYRLCQRVLMFHHFPDELGIEDYLVRSTDFTYAYEEDEKDVRNPIYTFLLSVTPSGYTRQGSRYLKRSLPPVEFGYSQPVVQTRVEEVDAESLENLPVGLDGKDYQWIDLHGEGLPGILTEQAGAWFYKRNTGPINARERDGAWGVEAQFAPAELVASKPNLSLAGDAQFMDLAGDGLPDLVVMDGPLPGLYEHDGDEGWSPFRPFTSRPNRVLADPSLRFVDLDGDGHADLLITEDDAFVWHASLAESGFGAEQRVAQAPDEEKGPRLVFADGTQSIYLADLSGDGLADLARIRNGEVCYWPNLGYGRFGAKVTMDGAPWFDQADHFDQARLRLADVDGSGTTDLIYLHRDGVRLYLNQSGNAWGAPRQIEVFPRVDRLVDIQATDLLGNGTACLVWSSPLPGDGQRPMRYINLMGDHKPHLLVKVVNNLGAETRVHYAPSLKFYLQDRRDGRPWITRLPFPVHVVERVETWDHVSRNRFVTTYAYHHGHFDGEEREFRGFGMVEQTDTEAFAALTARGELEAGDNVGAISHVPPVLTRTWFHTGIYLGRERVSRTFAGQLNGKDRGEYYREPAWLDDDDEAEKRLLPDTVLPGNLSLEEEREAARSLKGMMLRQEVYALDGIGKTSDYPYGQPYTVAEQSMAVRVLQSRGPNRHAVFVAHPSEAVTYHYERNPRDPRVQHALTLEVDDYGSVLKEAAIGYGRRQSPLAEQWDRDRQTTTLMTYTENAFTNAIDDTTQHPSDYRTPLPAETLTYELTGYTPAGNGDLYGRADIVRPAPANPGRLLHIHDGETAYEEPPAAGRQRRLIEHARAVYRKDDLTALLPHGALEPLALPGESYKLALTPGLLARVFARRRADGTREALLPNPVAPLLEGQGDDQGGYVAQDGTWWIPSGRVFYSEGQNDSSVEELAEAQDHFFLPRRYRDPFGRDTLVEYDGPAGGTLPRYDLLVTRTEDAVHNVVRVTNDYRVLGPRLMTDPNRNQTEVAFDALGLVAATSVRGKAEEDLGDETLDGYASDLAQEDIDGFYGASDPHLPAVGLLAGATTRVVYDLDRFRRTRQAHPGEPGKWRPACAATLARETHASDALPPQGLKIQLSFSYSDGFGREIQKKVQAEAGPVPQRGPDGRVVLDADGLPVMTPVDVSPRWVGSGWTVFNNKGKPVRQYEPFFADSHAFEFGVEVGVSPVLFYDPVGRTVAILHPNHTYEKVVFDPWQQVAYDVSDTVVVQGTVSGDPRTDRDIGSLVAPYFATQPAGWQTWHAQRATLPANDPQRLAAEQAALHANTPAVAHFDALGRPFLTIAYNRFRRQNGNGVLETVEEEYATRVELDIEGNQRQVTDAKGRVVMRYGYDLLGNRLHQASMEAGERWTLPDAAGKPIRAYDSRRFVRRMTYDPLRRPARLHVTENGAERLAERTMYGESLGDAANHRTRVHKVFDAAGVVTSEAYDFKGNLLRARRELLADYKQAVDWLQNLPANDGAFTTRITYDALNRPLTVTTPDGSVHRPAFNDANLLDKVDVNLQGEQHDGQPKWTPFVANVNYDAKGQRERIAYGNGAQTTYEYDPLTYRLARLLTTRPSGANGLAGLFALPTVVQDLRYTYDPAGNITRLEDAALRPVSHNNQTIVPVSSYTYDALYRLIEARGREHIGQTALDLEPPGGNRRDYPYLGQRVNPNDPEALRNYAENYEYDQVGNFRRMRHVAGNGGWTRTYDYEEGSLLEAGKVSNRLTRTTVGNGGNQPEAYTYDLHGNMTAINTMAMAWDFQDQLQRVDLGGGGTAYYVYDAAGQRVRKVIEHQNGARREERIYLAGYEIYRQHTGANAGLVRETLHVMDDKQRIALVETRTNVDDGTPRQVIRYQLGNHLGSASLELDADGALITYEEYHPYGTSAFQAARGDVEVAAKRYRYTAKERDEETGFSYHGARYYAPWLARWTSCDPAIHLNLYTYASNSPIELYDPDGREPTRYDPFNLFVGLKTATDPNPNRLPFNPNTGELDPRYFPPPATYNREDLERIKASSPERVLGRFAYDTLTGLLGVGTASAPANAAQAERDRRLYPGVGYGEQAASIALAMLPVEKILGYVFRGTRSLLAMEAKGVTTTAEKVFLREIDEGFKSAAQASSKEVAANLARGNFGERLAADSLAAEGHRIVSYKPSVTGTNQAGIDIVTVKDGMVFFVDNKALTRSGNVSSVTALTVNFAKNKEVILQELRALLGTNLSQEERQILGQAVKAIEEGNFRKMVTNANLAADHKILTGVTENLKKQGIEFKNVYTTGGK